MIINFTLVVVIAVAAVAGMIIIVGAISLIVLNIEIEEPYKADEIKARNKEIKQCNENLKIQLIKAKEMLETQKTPFDDEKYLHSSIRFASLMGDKMSEKYGGSVKVYCKEYTEIINDRIRFFEEMLKHQMLCEVFFKTFEANKFSFDIFEQLINLDDMAGDAPDISSITLNDYVTETFLDRKNGLYTLKPEYCIYRINFFQE